MRIAKGKKVRLYGTPGHLAVALHILDDIFKANDALLELTCGFEGVHSAQSRHYTGNAVDLRSRELTPAAKQRILADFNDQLGHDWLLLLETTHFHLQFKPTGPQLAQL